MKDSIFDIEQLINALFEDNFMQLSADIQTLSNNHAPIEERELDIIPYAAAAISYPKFVRNDIQNLFKKNKGTFYDAAQKSKHFNSLIFKELPLEHADISIKALGIFTFVQNVIDNMENLSPQEIIVAENYDKELFSLMKKGYKKIYAFFKRYQKGDEIDMMEFYDYIHNYFHNTNKLSAENSVHSITAALYFANYIGTPKNDAFIGTFLVNRDDFLKGVNRINLENAAPVMKKEIEILRKQLPKNLINQLNDSEYADYISPFDYIYDIEEISSVSLFDDFTLDKKDIDELLLTYIASEKNAEIDLNTYIIAGSHIKSLLKAYKKAKEFYFSNNKDSMYVELEKLTLKLNTANSQYHNEKQKNEELRKMINISNDNLSAELQELKMKNKKLQEEITKLQKEKKEINALREWIFRLRTSEETIADANNIECIAAEINELRGMVVGGHPNWKKKMEKYLPNWSFVPAEINPDANLIINSDIIIFNTAHLSHSVYNFTMSIVRECQCKMGYVQATNVSKALLEIKEQLK